MKGTQYPFKAHPAGLSRRYEDIECRANLGKVRRADEQIEAVVDIRRHGPHLPLHLRLLGKHLQLLLVNDDVLGRRGGGEDIIDQGQ